MKVVLRNTVRWRREGRIDRMVEWTEMINGWTIGKRTRVKRTKGQTDEGTKNEEHGKSK